LRRWHARDHHFVDAASVHVDNFEFQIRVFERIRSVRNTPEARHHEARERVIRARLVLGQLELELRDHLADGRRALDEPRVLAARHDRSCGFLWIARQRADQALEQVGDGHETFDRPEFVHYEREVPMRRAKCLEQLECGH
jgi:hypothetical protein